MATFLNGLLNGLSVWVAPVVFMLGTYETLVAEFIKGADVEREKARLGKRTTAACLMLIGIGKGSSSPSWQRGSVIEATR